MAEITNKCTKEDDDWFSDDEYISSRMRWLYAEKAHDHHFVKYSMARDKGDERCCSELERQNPYLEMLYDDEGPCPYNDEMRYENLLCTWLVYLKLNTRYKAYCEAKSSGASEDELEGLAKDTKAKQIYEDWGDIFIEEIPPKEWVRKNRHLFYPAFVETIEPGEIAPQHSLTISIPDGYPKRLFETEFKKLVMRVEKREKIKPKYQVSQRPAESLGQLIELLARAYLVHDLKHFHEMKIKNIMVEYFEESPVFEGLGVRQVKQKGGNKRDTNFYVNKYKSIIRLAEIYQNSIDATVNGVFPATPTKYK